MKSLIPSRILIAAGLCALVAASVRADSILLNPVADSEIHQFTPDANYGFGSSIASGKLGVNSGNEIRRALIRFDPSGQLPAGAVITGVSVSANVVRTPSTAPANSTFDLRRVLQSWSESGVTWNSHDQGLAWNSPGAEGSGDSIASASSSAFVTGLGPYTFPSTPALLADVQSWLNNPGTNFGWLLVSEDEVTSETARRFGAREDPANATVLEIDYVLAPTITTQPQDQIAFSGSSVSFTVDADGTAPLGFQWLFNTNAIVDATNQVLVLANISTNDMGYYSVIVSNAAGTVLSRQALLIVSNAPAGVPVVVITSPSAGANFPSFADVNVTADAQETNGTILQVEFDLVSNCNLVGSAIATNTPYSVIFSNLPAAAYLVTATATDINSNAATSSAVPFGVRRPPVATLLVTPPGTNFILGSIFTNTAIGTTDGGSANPVTNASFFDGPALIGLAQPPALQISYKPAATHLHSLTTVVYDSLGQAGTSAPVVVRISPVDHVPPSITLTSGPPSFSKVYSQIVTNAGKASDNDEVRYVQYQVMSGPSLSTLTTNATASGTSNWLAFVPLQPGNNFVRFRSVDFSTNLSAPLDRYYNYVVTNVLSLQTNGVGSVSPNLDGHWLNLGQIYTVTARPGAGQIFVGWHGPGVRSSQTILNFIMKPSMVLTATFIPNPFASRAGTYMGLFYETNQPVYANAGAVNFQASAAGTFSGRISLAGAAYGFAGQFDAAGNAVLPVLRPGHVPLVLDLRMGLNPGDTLISGFVTNVMGTNKYVAELLAFRNVHDPRTNAAPQAGLHAFTLQTSANGIYQTVGNGSAQVSTAGTALCKGALTPGPPFAFGNFLNAEGYCPFYLPLASGPGLILGWMNLGDGTLPTPSTLSWLTASPPGVELLQAIFNN